MSAKSSETQRQEISGALFRCLISDIRQLNEFWSPGVTIHGLIWRFQLHKVSKADKMMFGVFLHCENEKSASNWSCAAWARMKLVSFSDDNKSITKSINPDVYDSTSAWGISEFINCNDLFEEGNHFVKNDCIQIEVEIKTNRPVIDAGQNLFESLRCCANSSIGKFRWTVHSVEEHLAACSPQFFMRGSPFELAVFRVATSTENMRDLFGVSVRCKNPNTHWSWNVSISLSFLSTTEHLIQIPFEQNASEYILNANNSNASFVLLWRNLIKPENGIIRKNSIVIECEFRLLNPGENYNVNSTKKRHYLAELQCAICLENILYQRVSSTHCGHLFCSTCIERAIEIRKHCPLCNIEVDLINLRRIHLPM